MATYRLLGVLVVSFYPHCNPTPTQHHGGRCGGSGRGGAGVAEGEAGIPIKRVAAALNWADVSPGPACITPALSHSVSVPVLPLSLTVFFIFFLDHIFCLLGIGTRPPLAAAQQWVGVAAESRKIKHDVTHQHHFLSGTN